MNVFPPATIAAGGTVPVPSQFSFGNWKITLDVKTEIFRVGGHSPCILGPLYYDGPTPFDYQYGISETAKFHETPFQCANRGLIEELSLQFIGPELPFMQFKKTVKGGSGFCEQYWDVFIVHASNVRAATIASCVPVVPFMNARDFKRVVKPGLTCEKKSQVIVYGTSHELQTLVGTMAYKPVTPVTREFYDAPIKGLAIRPA